MMVHYSKNAKAIRLKNVIMGHPTDQAKQMDPTNKSCEQINHLTQSQSTRVKWDFMRKAGVKFFVNLFCGV